MPVPAALDKLWKEFDGEYKKNGPNCDKLCSQLKLEISKCGNQLLLEGQDAQILQLAREVYERGAFLAIKRNDIPSFERNVKQLKIYYRDFNKKIGVQSANEYKILGLYLLALLAGDRIGEFHTELELVHEHTSQFIQRPVMLERYLMEGNYAKINQSVAEFSTQEYYPIFLEQLLDTMRRRIIESLERSTIAVALDRVAKMLYMKSAAEVKTFLTKMREEKMNDEDSGWEIVGDKFQVGGSLKVAKVAAFQTIGHMIDYATEIERIV